ncbi:MAG: CsbD family protein [Alcanivoracaceae bacterium]|nr:CsbD family protein [Alcanivoracaceae bacterium]
MSMFNREKLEGQWNQHLGSAKILWGKLTDDEILKSEGRADRLSGLVEKRYAISRDQADQQVKAFLKGHKF